MGEHSKGPELEYDAGRGEFVASGVVVGFLVPDPRLGRASVAVYERDALGRKMAAAPDLVEAVQRLTRVLYANTAVGMHSDRKHPGSFEECQDSGCRQALDAISSGDAALEKAGVDL